MHLRPHADAVTMTLPTMRRADLGHLQDVDFSKLDTEYLLDVDRLWRVIVTPSENRMHCIALICPSPLTQTPYHSPPHNLSHLLRTAHRRGARQC